MLDSEIARAKSLLAQGFTYEAIARRIGVPRGTGFDNLRPLDAWVERVHPGAQFALSDDECRQIRSWCECWDVTESGRMTRERLATMIAERLKKTVCVRTVRRALARARIVCQLQGFTVTVSPPKHNWMDHNKVRG